MGSRWEEWEVESWASETFIDKERRCDSGFRLCIVCHGVTVFTVADDTRHRVLNTADRKIRAAAECRAVDKPPISVRDVRLQQHKDVVSSCVALRLNSSWWW